MSAADDFEEWRYRERNGIPHPTQGGPPRGTYGPKTQDALRRMAEDIKREARERRPHGARPVPVVATPLLEPDGVVWQITTLGAP